MVPPPPPLFPSCGGGRGTLQLCFSDEGKSVIFSNFRQKWKEIETSSQKLGEFLLETPCPQRAKGGFFTTGRKRRRYSASAFFLPPSFDPWLALSLSLFWEQYISARSSNLVYELGQSRDTMYRYHRCLICLKLRLVLGI